MKKQLTDKAIKALKPQTEPNAKRYQVWDSSFTQRGAFGVRVTPSGVKSFVWVYRDDSGKQTWKTIGTYPVKSLAAAREEARKDAAKLELEGTVRKEDVEKSFGDVAERYMRNQKDILRERTLKEYQRILDKDILPCWQNRKIRSITRTDVNDLLDEIANDRQSPVMANRVLALASVVFNFALDRELIEVNPCFRIKKRVVEKGRDRVLSAEEIQKLWEHLEGREARTSAVYQLCLLTLQRSGEIKEMKWNQIEGDTWTIPESGTKNKTEHKVPLSQPVVDILNKLRETADGSGFVFPADSKSGHVEYSQKNTQRICKAVGFDFRPHDLRRTGATNLSMLGVDDTIIGRILNHSWMNRQITSIYNRHKPYDEMRTALERWASRLQQILTEQPAKVVKIR